LARKRAQLDETNDSATSLPITERKAMKNQFARSDAGRLATSLFALCFAFSGLIPAAHAQENDETTKSEHESSAAVEHATIDADEPLTEETKTANATDVDEPSANGASSQTPDPKVPTGKNIQTGQPVHPTHKVGAASEGASLAEKATDPSAILTQMSFQFFTENTKDDRGLATTGIFQPILPLTSGMILRPTLPIVTTGGTDGVTGIGDLFLLDLFLHNVNKATFGVGPVATVPTATSDALGGKKWTIGPNFLFLFKGVPKNLFGILIYNEWSFAGDTDRAKVNRLSFQPVYTLHTSWGYIGWNDLPATIDWENDNALSFPVGPRIGKVWMGKTPVNLSAQLYYRINNHGRENSWGFKAEATLIMPTWLQH
jgi:hypothetical protein